MKKVKTYKAGDRVCTYLHFMRSVNGGKAWADYYATATYEARTRKRDGVLTWRRVDLSGSWQWAHSTAQKACEEWAAHHGYPIDHNTGHNQPCNPEK